MLHDDTKLASLRRAEYAVCGAVMAGELEEVRKAGIKPRTFYYPAARRVFAIVEELDAERKATDATHVAIALEGEKLDGEKADEAVLQMEEAYTTKALLQAYVEEVVDGYERRVEAREARGLLQALADGNAGEIALARARLAECAKAGAGRHGLTLVSDEELIARHSTPPEELVEGLLAVGELALLVAPSKKGKTWFLLQMAKSIAAGIPFLGRKTKQGPVVYVNSEVGEVWWEGRTRRVGEELDIAPPPLYHACTRGQIVSLSNLGDRLKSGMDSKGLKQVAAIIIDPFYSLAGGIDENAAGEVAEVMLGLQRLGAEIGAAVIVAHHTGKGDVGLKSNVDRARGSSAFGGTVDTKLCLVPKGKQTLLEVTRRNAKEPEPRILQLDAPLWADIGPAVPDSAGVVGTPKRFTVDTIVKAFAFDDEVLSVGEIVDRTGMGKSTAYGLAKQGIEQDVFVRAGKDGKGYRLNNKGKGNAP